MCAPYSDIIFVLFYCFDFFFVFNLYFNDVHIFVQMMYKQYWFVINSNKPHSKFVIVQYVKYSTVAENLNTCMYMYVFQTAIVATISF